jgi:hypothetical protein
MINLEYSFASDKEDKRKNIVTAGYLKFPTKLPVDITVLLLKQL